MRTFNKNLVCGIVVTYNPDLEKFAAHLQNNRSNFGLTIIVDNSTERAIQVQIASFNGPGLEVLQNMENLGIAAAQNIGFRRALDLNFGFIVQLDQDSHLMAGYSEKMLAAYNDLQCIHPNLVAVGPRPVPFESAAALRKVEHDAGRFERKSELQSSGLLMRSSALQTVGFMREDLFIDLVDYEWCWRATARSLVLFQVNDTLIYHRLGNSFLSFRTWELTIPHPVRHYYQFRNSLVLIHEGLPRLPWTLRRLLIMVFKLLLYPLLLPQGRIRLRHMLRGIQDFRRFSSGSGGLGGIKV